MPGVGAALLGLPDIILLDMLKIMHKMMQNQNADRNLTPNNTGIALAAEQTKPKRSRQRMHM